MRLKEFPVFHTFKMYEKEVDVVNINANDVGCYTQNHRKSISAVNIVRKAVECYKLRILTDDEMSHFIDSLVKNKVDFLPFNIPTNLCVLSEDFSFPKSIYCFVVAKSNLDFFIRHQNTYLYSMGEIKHIDLMGQFVFIQPRKEV